LKVLPRYHLENYFLEESVIAPIFDDMEREGSWLRDPASIRSRIEQLSIQAIPVAVALKVAAAAREGVGNIDIMPGGINQDTTADELVSKIIERASSEKARVSLGLDLQSLEKLAREEYSALMASFGDGSNRWKYDIPGRIWRL
jgi:hypothetical protein